MIEILVGVADFWGICGNKTKYHFLISKYHGFLTIISFLIKHNVSKNGRNQARS
jgi:hypothetical protein